MIRESKALNQFLYDNSKMLKILFDDACNKKPFTYEAACDFFNSIKEKDQESLVPDMRTHFVHCQMTNLRDLNNPRKYQYLVFVELLEMICRVAHHYWELRRENNQPRPNVDVTPYPRDIAEEVAVIVYDLFMARFKKNVVAKLAKKFVKPGTKSK